MPVNGLTNPPVPGTSNPTGVKGVVTADYDLFGIWPHKNRASNTRKLTPPPRTLQGSVANTYVDHIRSQGPGGNENPHIGNLHRFGEQILSNLNQGVEQAGYNGGRLFHHNDESGNPFSPGQDYPLILFMPGEEKPFEIKNDSELQSTYKIIEDKGYFVEKNPAFSFPNFDSEIVKQHEFINNVDQDIAAIGDNVDFKAGTFTNFEGVNQQKLRRSFAIVQAYVEYLASQNQSDSQRASWLEIKNSLAELNNGRAFGQLSDSDQGSFTHYITELTKLDPLVPSTLHHEGQFTVDALVDKIQTTTTSEPHSYLLTLGEQTLTVSVIQKNEQQQYTVHGVFVGDASNIETSNDLHSILKAYIDNSPSSHFDVATISHQALEASGAQQVIQNIILPVETTLDRLVSLDDQNGKIQLLDEIYVKRELLYDIGAMVNGAAIDSHTNFQSIDLNTSLTFSKGKLLNYIHNPSTLDRKEVTAILKAVTQAHIDAGLPGNVIVESGDPDHWLRKQLDTVSRNKLALSQATQLLELGKTNDLTVKLNPATSKNIHHSLSDVLAIASLQGSVTDPDNMLINQNRSRFLSELAYSGRQTDAEALALENYNNAKSNITSRTVNEASFKQDLGHLTIRRLSEHVNSSSSTSLVLQSGNHHYLLSKQNN